MLHSSSPPNSDKIQSNHFFTPHSLISTASLFHIGEYKKLYCCEMLFRMEENQFLIEPFVTSFFMEVLKKITYLVI